MAATAIERLTRQLSRLPGIGPKSALRIAYYLLYSDPEYASRLGAQIGELRNKVCVCSVCGSFGESDPCVVCMDSGRNRSIICVVEQAHNVYTIEATHEYNGLYHVLNGVISPIDGVGPQDIAIDSLLRRIESGGIHEIIVATNPTVEGDTTAHFLGRLLEKRGVRATRLAFGLPVGGDLEYADRLTVSRALQGRSLLGS